MPTTSVSPTISWIKLAKRIVTLAPSTALEASCWVGISGFLSIGIRRSENMSVASADWILSGEDDAMLAHGFLDGFKHIYRRSLAHLGVLIER
jgi:hypothetical protein